MEKLGTITFDGKLYNLDNMSIEELEKLLNDIENKKLSIMKELEEYIEELEKE